MNPLCHQVFAGSWCFFIATSVRVYAEPPRDQPFDGHFCSDAVLNMAHGDKEPTVNRPHVGKQEINEGIFLVIHKITDGLPVGRESIDRQYVTIAEDAQCAGIQWGAYHFSRYEGYNEQTKLFKRPPKEQAEYFVARVYQNKPANAASVLLAWDFEADNGEMMSIPAMAVAVEEVQLLTGKYPGIYVNGNFARKNLTMKGISRSLTNDALARLKNPQMKTGAKKVLQKCLQWVASYDHLPLEDC